jgi:Na+/melibiose symporter-like transporter
MEYGHYKNGERQEGIHFALQTFMTKITAAIVSSLSLVILGWFGFASQDADKATGMVSAEAGKGFWFVFTVISAIGSIVAIPILIKFFTLREKDVQYMSLYNNGEITREECDKNLSREY